MKAVCVVLQVMRSITRCEPTRRCVFWSEWECRMPKPSPLSRGERTWWQMGNAGPRSYTQQERHLSVWMSFVSLLFHSVLNLLMHFIYLINTEKPKTHPKLITVSLIHCHMYCSSQKREEKTKTLVCLKKKCKYQCSVECTELYENHSLLPSPRHTVRMKTRSIDHCVCPSKMIWMWV